MTRRKQLFFLSCFTCLSVFCAGWTFLSRSNLDRPLKRSELIMDTIFTVIVYGENPEYLKQTVEAVFEEIRRIEKLTNRYDPESGLSRLNAAAEEHPTDADELFSLIKTTFSLAESTERMFDPTLGPVIDLWQFSRNDPPIPKDSALKTALAATGLDKVSFGDDGRIILNDGVCLNLSGVAKGYAVDLAFRLLQGAGVRHFLVDGGGEVRAHGGKPDGQPWRIGIKDPRASGCLGIIEAASIACATSGDYERYFEKEGVRYHHILNPATGHPARGAASATVVAQTVLEADVLATASIVGGPSSLEMLNERFSGAGFILVLKNGHVMCTGSLPDKLDFSPGIKILHPGEGNSAGEGSSAGEGISAGEDSSK